MEEEEEDCSQWRCKYCDNVGLTLAEDGYYYCNLCAAQSQDFIDTSVADEEFGGPGAIYTASLRRSCRPSQSQQPTTTSIKSESQQFFSQFTNQTPPLDDGVGPTQPEDFGGTANANANGNEEIGGGELGYEKTSSRTSPAKKVVAKPAGKKVATVKKALAKSVKSKIAKSSAKKGPGKKAKK
ncbi:hypothetical protein ACFE04_028110 [Oxalis oulophora]